MIEGPQTIIVMLLAAGPALVPCVGTSVGDGARELDDRASVERIGPVAGDGAVNVDHVGIAFFDPHPRREFFWIRNSRRLLQTRRREAVEEAR